VHTAHGHATDVSRRRLVVVVVVVIISNPRWRSRWTTTIPTASAAAAAAAIVAPDEETRIEVEFAICGLGLVQRAQRESIEWVERYVQVLADLAKARYRRCESTEVVLGDRDVHGFQVCVIVG
jgi:hypothetical protein